MRKLSPDGPGLRQRARLDERARLLREWIARAGPGWALSGAATLMDAASAGIRALSPRARYRIADALSWPFLRFWLPTRPAIARNYAALLKVSATHPEAQRLARRSVRNYGRMAMDFLAVRTMSDAEIRAWASGSGWPHMDEALRGGRGVIMALPHLGSWDVAAAYAQAHGLRLTVVTEDTWAARLVAGSRRGHGVTLAPRTGSGSMRALFRALARNECVAILCDVAPEGVPTVDVPFFGRPAALPIGPARLAQRTGAPVLVASSVRLPDHSYLVAGQPLLRPDPTKPAEEAVVQLTTAIAAGFERIIIAYPAQWYPFHPIWPAQP